MASKKVTGSKVEMTEVLNCHRVPTKLYMDVKDQMYRQLSRLLPNKTYKLKQMCGKHFWKPLKNPDRKNAGRAFAHMVVIGVFPFKFVEKKSTSKHYRLK